MPSREEIIRDKYGDEAVVETFRNSIGLTTQSGVSGVSDSGMLLALTPAQSKQIRKALKRAERVLQGA